MKKVLIALVIALVIAGCEGKQGPIGPAGIDERIYQGTADLGTVVITAERTLPDYVLAYTSSNPEYGWTSASVFYHLDNGYLSVYFTGNPGRVSYKIVCVRDR